MDLHKVSLIFVLMCCQKCLGQENEPNLNKYLFNESRFQFIDLTYSTKRRVFNTVNEREWVGTTLDLELKPASSYPTLVHTSTSSVPLDKLILPLIIADISGQVGNNSNFVLQKHHLDFFLNNYFGNTKQPCLIVFKFGWLKYASSDDINISPRPGISVDVANWITTAYKNVVGVGVDLPSVDPGLSAEYTAHNTLVDAGLYVVENVKLDHHLPEAWCTAVLLPQSSHEPRAPARLVAICPKHRMVDRREILWHRL